MKQAINHIRNKLLAVALVLGLMAVPVGVVPVSDATAKCDGAADCLTDGLQNVKTGSTSLEDTIKSITNVLLFLIAAVSVIMLILGGFKYVTSNGNADQIKSAKNTIMYAIIGLVVAILAYAIVGFVIDAFIGTSGESSGGGGSSVFE